MVNVLRDFGLQPDELFNPNVTSMYLFGIFVACRGTLRGLAATVAPHKR